MSKFIRYTECPVKINEDFYLAKRASIGAQASATNPIEFGGKVGISTGIGPERSEFFMQYFVTGENDPIANLTGKNSCSGSFGGIEFSGAYLTNYHIGIKPYAPVEMSARFVVLSGFNNNIQESSFLENDYTVANGANVELTNMNYLNIGMDNPVEITYEVACERIPSFVIGSSYPRHVNLGAVEKYLDINGDDIGDVINYQERDVAEISIKASDELGRSRGQTLFCSGAIENQRLDVSAGGTLNGQVSIKEVIR